MNYHGVDELRIPLELWERIERTRKRFERKGNVYEKLDQNAYLVHLLEVAIGLAERELQRREVSGKMILTPEEASRLDWER